MLESTAETGSAKPHLESIKMNERIVPTKRHPIDNLEILPTKFGFSLIGGDDEGFCQDYDFRTHPNPTGQGSEIWMVTYVDKDGIKVWDNGIKRASYIIDPYFSSPQIVRLGDGNVENGTYFVLDRRTIRKPEEVDRLFGMKDDDISKITAGGLHISEEELDKSRVKLEGIKRMGEIKRIGEHVLVAGETEDDETKLFVIDKKGKTVLSEQVGFQIDRIVPNQKGGRENKFIIVTKTGKIIITELVKEDRGLNLKYSNNSQTQKIDHVTNLRNLIDASIFGDEIAVVAMSGKLAREVSKKFVSIISGDGSYQIMDQEIKEDITGVAYLKGYLYKLFRKENCLNAALVTRG